jgi:hypothetical protein
MCLAVYGVASWTPEWNIKRQRGMKHDITGQHSPIPQSLFVRDFFHFALALHPWLFEAYELSWTIHDRNTWNGVAVARQNLKLVDDVCE